MNLGQQIEQSRNEQKRGLVIYDLDGTLIDSRADLVAAVNRARLSFGLPQLSFERIVAAVGDGRRFLVARTIAEDVAPFAEREAAVMREYRAALLDATTLYKGAREMLCALRDGGWRQALVTNKPVEATAPILEGLQISDFFSVVIGAEDGLPLKPDPAPLRLALERAGGSNGGAVWMVGDNHTDLASANAAGFKRCFCRYGFGNARDQEWDLAINEPLELARHLLGSDFKSP